jgi:GDPmannose 4,6-dehydratase
LLLGDASKAKARLGWTPTATLEDLVREMMESDLALMAARRSGA